MAIQTAGQKTAKVTKLKIEDQSTIDLPKGAHEQIQKALEFLPIEHQRGLEKVKLVDFINDPRLKNMDVPIKGDLPGLYHPRVQNQGAWLEPQLVRSITPEDVRWTAGLLSRLTPRQWSDAFRAAGFGESEANRYIRRLQQKIAEGLRVGDF